MRYVVVIGEDTDSGTLDIVILGSFATYEKAEVFAGRCERRVGSVAGRLGWSEDDIADKQFSFSVRRIRRATMGEVDDAIEELL